MKANILVKGKRHSIYTLSEKGKSEVEELLVGEHADPIKRSAALGFLAKLEHIADAGIWTLHVEWADCWNESNPEGKFCELKNGDYRISYFVHGRRILLATYFVKQSMKESREYARAIRLNDRFAESPNWDESE